MCTFFYTFYQATLSSKQNEFVKRELSSCAFESTEAFVLVTFQPPDRFKIHSVLLTVCTSKSHLLVVCTDFEAIRRLTNYKYVKLMSLLKSTRAQLDNRDVYASK